MSSEPTLRQMIVAVDGSPSSTAAVNWAARDAAMRGFAITLVHVVSSPLTRQFPELSRRLTAVIAPHTKDATTILDEAVTLVGNVPGGRELQVDSELHGGRIVDTLVGLSVDADMMVVGFRGHGLLGASLLGPVSSGLVHHAHCPVAVIHAEEPERPLAADAPVVVGIDGSPSSELATEIAFEEAHHRRVDLVAVHACSDQPVSRFAGVDRPATEPPDLDILGSVLPSFQDRYPEVTVRRVVVDDRPSTELIKQSESAQLVVVGSHGRGGFSGTLLGSVSSAVVQTADVPVIVARHS